MCYSQVAVVTHRCYHERVGLGQRSLRAIGLLFDMPYISAYTHIDCYNVCHVTALTMGGAVSAGRNNHELVTNLCKEDYIRTPEVERVRCHSLL